MENFNQYRSKVYGCFVGKCVGGTLGMKYEGNLDFNNVTYYDPVPTEMIPNDDLDLQVVNLETVLRTGLPVCRYYLGETWKYHVADFAPDEYAVGISNNRLKLFAPLSGKYRNKFYAGMGAAIRSELWACLAPASPTLAAYFAREDACTDHSSDGIYAEMFLAALESAAFTENDLIKLIDIGLEFIPEGHKLKNAFSDTILWWNESGNIITVREKILKKYFCDNWTDVTINLSFIILSLLACEGSFDKAICTAASLGYDADCTCATVGSIFGIMEPDSIDEKWTAPIGDKVLLSTGIVNMHEAESINDFCDSIISLAGQVEKYYNTGISLNVPDKDKKIKIWTQNWKSIYDWQENATESLLLVKPFPVTLVYPENVASVPNKKNGYFIKISNTTDKNISGCVSLLMPDGFTVTCPNNEFSIEPDSSCEIPFTVEFTSFKRRVPLNLLTVEINADGIVFEVEANIPVSMPWLREDLKTGATDIVEAESIVFNIPKGEYKYTAKFISSAARTVRGCASGDRLFTVYVNGEMIREREDRGYVPAFHRGYDWFRANLLRGENLIEVVFKDGAEGEFFFNFAEDTRLPIYIDSFERIL